MGDASRWQDALAPQDAPTIRLFDAAQSTPGRGGLSADMTLSAFVAAYVKPVLMITRDSRARSFEAIDDSVNYWVRFTGDPPLAAINVYHVRDFVVGLRSLPGRKYSTLGNNTIRKHCAAIQKVLDICAPASRGNRDGIGILDAATIPYVARPPKSGTKCEDAFTLEELIHLVNNADAARLPKKLPCSPGQYMRRLMVFDFNTGLRPQGFMLATWRHYHGTHLILPARTVAKGLADQRVELNDTARAIVESMDGHSPERIFPWPRWPESRKALYRQFNLVRECLPKARRFAWYGIRRLHTDELAKINPLAVQKSLGHTTARTTVENYTGSRLVAGAVAKLPALPTGPEKQRKLFD